MNRVKPLADRVLVLPEEAQEKTESGIIIPDTAKEQPNRGTILAVGEGTKDVTMQLSDGDKVLYGKYAGIKVDHEGKDCILLKQSDILAILTK